MHYVCRGAEPNTLSTIRSQYTNGWVGHYLNGIGDKPPTDKKWRQYLGVLGNVFGECCGYCEEYCKGEVDHYKPKKLFPDLVYVWDNWVYACHTCNNNKGETWLSSGFMDPCSLNTFGNGMKSCFIYDLETGEALPNPSLSKARRNRAQETIRVLNLNSSNRLKSRLDHICMIEALAKLAEQNDNSAIEELAFRGLPKTQYCSLTCYFIAVC